MWTILEAHYAQGCTQAAQLFREIKAQGYSGKTPMPIQRWLRAKRLLAGEDPVTAYTGLPVTNCAPLPSDHKLSWLLVLPPQRLDQEGQQFLTHICKDARIAHFYQMAQAFRRLVTTRSVSALDTWLTAASSSPIPQVRTFAKSLRDEYDYMRAALEYPWSNGQTEGQVNRLKFIKRQMYGRASFALLRQKVLYQPGST